MRTTTTGAAPSPSHARPAQVLLGVGAVLVVVAAAALAGTSDTSTARAVLIGAAVAVAALCLFAARLGLPSTAETLAVTAAGLALAATASDGSVLEGPVAVPAAMAAAFLALRFATPAVLTWPLASWAALQLAAVRLLGELPAALGAEGRLLVALTGLAVAIGARRTVARVALVSTAPWWLAGVVGGTVDSWSAEAAGRWTAAVLVVLAAAGLVLARFRADLDPLLGAPRTAPVVAGAVIGAALTGATVTGATVTGATGFGATGGTVALVLLGWTGIALPSLADVVLGGWRRGLLLPTATAGGATTTALCLVLLVQAGAWGALSLLLLLVAFPPAAVGALRPADRHATVPVAVWCVSGAVLLALPAGILTAGPAGVLLAGVYTVAMAVGAGLGSDVRRPTARAAGLTGLAAVVLVAVTGERAALVAVLVVQGLATLGWAVGTGRRTSTDVVTAAPDDPVADEVSAGWKVGAAHLTVACWTLLALGDARGLEAWTLPAAGGLLVAAGPRLLRAPSWPAWGPGLVVALAPSTAWAALDPGLPRTVFVLGASVLLLAGGGALGVLAPLVVGAAAPVVLVLGLAVQALPWPLAAALVAGSGLLVWGALREGRPVNGFVLRLAELR